jgi:hypothetical protein
MQKDSSQGFSPRARKPTAKRAAEAASLFKECNHRRGLLGLSPTLDAQVRSS